MKLKFLLLIPILSLFSITSCKSSNNDEYKNKIKDGGNRLVLTGDIKKNYTSGESISIGDLTVKFDNSDINYFDSNEDKIIKDRFFVTASKESPTISRIKPSDKLNTGNQSYTTNFYIALINSSDDYVYISDAKQITIKNPSAMNPILYYVGGAVIIVAVAGIVFFAKRYKETH